MRCFIPFAVVFNRYQIGRVLGVGIGMIVFSSSLVAAPALSIQEAYLIALASHESIQQQESRVAAAKARVDQAIGSMLTQVNLKGSQTFQDSVLSSESSNQFTTSSRPDYKISVTQPLFAGFRDWDTLSGLQRSLSKERYALFESQRELFRQVMMAYMQVISSERELASQREGIALSQERITELRNRVRLGKSREGDILNSQAQLFTLQAQEQALQEQVAIARLTLSDLLHRDVQARRVVDPVREASVIPSDNVLMVSVDHHPLMKQLEDERWVYVYQKRAASRGILPTISLGGNYYLKRTETLDPIKWDLAITADFPLFQGGRDWAVAREANAMILEVEAAIKALRRQLELAIRSDVISVRSAERQFTILSDAYEKSKLGYQSVLSEYRLGLVNNLDVLQSLQTLLDIKRQLDQAQTRLAQNVLQFKLDRQELP